MRRIRRSIKRKAVIVIVFCLLQCVGGLSCYAAVRYFVTRKYAALSEEKDSIIAQAKRTVYITRTFVEAGALFTEENIEKRAVLSEQNPEGLETEVLGKIACADLPEGSIVTKALCGEPEISATERECAFREIKDTEYFADGAVVELRIRYDNGENYCVLKRKRLRKTEDEKDVCRLYLTEEEQLLLSAAQYDVQIYDGAELYVVGFMEERIQKEANSEYLPPIQIMMQLSVYSEEYERNSGEKREQRIALETRLSEYMRKRKDGML